MGMETGSIGAPSRHNGFHDWSTVQSFQKVRGGVALDLEPPMVLDQGGGGFVQAIPHAPD